MQSSNAGRLIAAFFLGLVVALGSAYLFMRPAASQPTSVAAAAIPTQTAAPAVASPRVEERLDSSSAVTVAAPKPAAKHRVTTPRSPAMEESAVARPAASSPVLDATQSSPSLPPVSPAPIQIASTSAPPPPVFRPAPELAAVPQTPHVVTLHAGTTLNVRLNETLTSEKNATGDAFRATLTAPVIVDGFVIADKGSRVTGQVIQADRSGRVKGRANLDLAITEINTTDGQRVRVQTDTFSRQAASGVGGDAAKVAGGAALGALIGGLTGGGKGAGIGAGAGGAAGTGVVLGTRGKEVTLANETPITFRLNAPVTITEQLRN